MKRVFDLGMSIVPIMGFRRHLTIEVEYGGQPYRNPDEGYFVIRGQIGGGRRWVYAGQCQKRIRKVCKKKWHGLLDELLDLDDKYWLNFCKSIPKKDAKRIKEIIIEGV